MVLWCTLAVALPHTPQTRMCTLVNHDLRAHWAAIVARWGVWAADCSDFELAHKWALKQFVRLVPHGKFFQAHMAHRHLGQFAFSHGQDAPAAPEEPLRYCHCEECKASPGTHPLHVHVLMPGLHPEDAEGRLTAIPRSEGRSVEVLDVADESPDFQRALQRLMGEVQGLPRHHAHMPATVCRASRMQLLWHGVDGKVQYQDTFHAADDYYGGEWYDVGKAHIASVGNYTFGLAPSL